ncbi:hypothetical protein TRP66_04095 [Pseudomonas sp. JDS28PS106]|uniref:hypothetical protein n=1 Tax=Pseudomonas sp. JDS28PS106 TaxID=2497235 RepID=UPI002FCF1A59
MGKIARHPFYVAGIPLLATGCAFAAVGASGQEAFAWTAAGLLVPGVVLLTMGIWRSRNARA